MTLGWNRVEMFSQVELAEELVETEEEMKKELSQEFTRWRKQKKIGTISNNLKGSRLCRSVIPCRALRKPMVANFVLMWVLVRDYLETLCSLCVLNGNNLLISLSFLSLQWLTWQVWRCCQKYSNPTSLEVISANLLQCCCWSWLKIRARLWLWRDWHVS